MNEIGMTFKSYQSTLESKLQDGNSLSKRLKSGDWCFDDSGKKEP